MPLTHFYAEFYGLFLIIFSLSMFVHKEMYMGLIHDIEHNRTTIYVLSVLGLVLGLFTVLTHNVWDADLLTVVVTIVGWVVLLKSTVYLALPNRFVHTFVRAMRLAKNYKLYTIIAFIVGFYLLVNGIWGF